jgi:hypothetical protein
LGSRRRSRGPSSWGKGITRTGAERRDEAALGSVADGFSKHGNCVFHGLIRSRQTRIACILGWMPRSILLSVALCLSIFMISVSLVGYTTNYTVSITASESHIASPIITTSVSSRISR